MVLKVKTRNICSMQVCAKSPQKIRLYVNTINLKIYIYICIKLLNSRNKYKIEEFLSPIQTNIFYILTKEKILLIKKYRWIPKYGTYIES